MAIVGIKETDKDNDSYEIQWGDTLSQIAIDNDTTVEALAQLNGIKDPDRIRAGGSLIIPTQPRKKKEATLPPQQAARQAAFEAAAQKYASNLKEEPTRKEERQTPPPREDKTIVGETESGSHYLTRVAPGNIRREDADPEAVRNWEASETYEKYYKAKGPREDAAKIAQLEEERQKDPRWVKVPIETGESIWRKLKPFKTMEYRDRNRNAIEDRDEGMYLSRDFQDLGKERDDEGTLNIFGREVTLGKDFDPDPHMMIRPDLEGEEGLGSVFGKYKPIRPDPMIINPRIGPIEGGYSPLFQSLLDERPAGEEETSWEKRHGFASPEVEAASLLSREEDKKELSSTVIPSPIKYVWGSLWGKGTGQTRTGADVGEDVVQVTKDAKDNAIAAGRSHVHYEDYGETNRGLPVAALVGAAKDASGRKLSPKERQSLSSQRRKAYPKNPIGAARLVYDLFTDPKVKAALTIGGFSIRGDEGSQYLEDVFNFNTANSGDKDWYAFIRKVLSNSGLMPIDDKEGIKTRIELS